MYSISADCYRCSSEEEVIENQNYIKALLTATENIAQWGHRESVGSDKRGIFLEMLNLVSNHDPVVKKRLEQQAKNAFYISKQSKMTLSYLAETVTDNIMQEVKESTQFSVITDKTKDVKKSE